MAKKIRADQLAVEQGLAESREQAKRMVMAGQVYVLRHGEKEPVLKPGQQLSREEELVAKGGDRFVSRGGHKLFTAIEAFGIDVQDKVCLDAGASTGGFTDCLLQHGAARVYAVDVGYGQLHQRMRDDARVVVHERTNLRTAPEDLIPEPIDLVVADVSFISLTLILPPCLRWLAPGGAVAALVKPQFELGPHQTDKGVVRDEALQLEAVEKIKVFAQDQLGLTCQGVVPSKIKGPKGNQEYIIYLTRD